MDKLTHLSLFSGIGGLDLAAEWAGFETVGQCEWADYPTKVLEKHWPNVPRWRNIYDFGAVEFERRTGQKTVDCISGGFPCQPHSVAGKREASDDERDLWPEMRRVISEIKPRWVVGENVRGLLSSEDGRFFRGILGDFANLGYDVAWCVTSAAAVGAVHRRERLAIIAYAHEHGLQGRVLEEQSGVSKLLSAALDSRDLLHEIPKDELPKSGICSSLNGIPHGMDDLRAYGNSVCWMSFYPIFKSIADIEMESAVRTISKAETVVANSAITDRATVEQSSAVDKESFTTDSGYCRNGNDQ